MSHIIIIIINIYSAVHFIIGSLDKHLFMKRDSCQQFRYSNVANFYAVIND